jgi:hypothetical protein
MPKHRSLNLQKFVTSIPEPLIKEYFQKKLKIDPLPLKSFDYESINQFLDTIHDETLKTGILEDFTHINDISEKTTNILVKAIKKYNIITTGKEERHALAMDIFLHHENAYEYAYDYYCLFNSASKMSCHNITAKEFKLTSEKKTHFEDQIKEFYATSEKGQECIIRYHEENDQVVIVVIRGSYKQSKSIWKDRKVGIIVFRPATEDILQYDKTRCVLSIKAPYQQDKENYIATFAESIIDDKSQATRADRDTTYTLKPLQDGTFSYNGNEKIKSVKLLEIEVAIKSGTKPTIKLKSSDIRKTLQEEITSISLSSGELVHAKLGFELIVGKKTKMILIEITPPNVTELTKKKYADIIDDYLKKNGVKLV